MVLPNPLNCIYDDTINNSKDAQAAENKLQDAPGDMTTRARLMHYYYNSEVLQAHRKVSINRDRRLQHACWFIQNASDLRFCGTSPFYFLESDERWETARQVWQGALTESATIDTQINAAMCALSADSELGREWIESLFPADSMNIWVVALRDLVNGTDKCFEETVEIERRSSQTINDESRQKILSELKTRRDWDRKPATSFEFDEECDLHAIWSANSPLTLEAAQKVAFLSYLKFETNAILRFDPEMIGLRFYLASWTIRNIPFSRLANDPFFTGPFENHRRYSCFEFDAMSSFGPLFRALGDIWIEQLRENPSDKRIAKNATAFANNAAPLFRKVSRDIFSQLNKTN